MTNRERIENFNDEERFKFLLICSNDCRTLTSQYFNSEFVNEEKFWKNIKNEATW